MSVSLLEISAAAELREASLAGEIAGYLILAAAEQLAQAPRTVALEGITLEADGSMRLGSGMACSSADGERQLRELLSELLMVACSVTPALLRAARRPAAGGIAHLILELETALIPVNRAAARRAMARLYRETLRVRDSLPARPQRARPAQPAEPERLPEVELRGSVERAAPEEPSPPPQSVVSFAEDVDVLGSTSPLPPASLPAPPAPAPAMDDRTVDERDVVTKPEPVLLRSVPPPQPLEAVEQPVTEISDCRVGTSAPLAESSAPEPEVVPEPEIVLETEVVLETEPLVEPEQKTAAPPAADLPLAAEPAPPVVTPSVTEMARDLEPVELEWEIADAEVAPLAQQPGAADETHFTFLLESEPAPPVEERRTAQPPPVAIGPAVVGVPIVTLAGGASSERSPAPAEVVRSVPSALDHTPALGSLVAAAPLGPTPAPESTPSASLADILVGAESEALEPSPWSPPETAPAQVLLEAAVAEPEAAERIDSVVEEPVEAVEAVEPVEVVEPIEPLEPVEPLGFEIELDDSAEPLPLETGVWSYHESSPPGPVEALDVELAEAGPGEIWTLPPVEHHPSQAPDPEPSEAGDSLELDPEASPASSELQAASLSAPPELPARSIYDDDGGFAPLQSDVSELIANFQVSEQRHDDELRSDLKRMVGLEPTPAPSSSVLLVAARDARSRKTHSR